MFWLLFSEKNWAKMEQQQPMEGITSKTKEHFGSMVHKVNTEKLRDMLREVHFL